MPRFKNKKNYDYDYEQYYGKRQNGRNFNRHNHSTSHSSTSPPRSDENRLAAYQHAQAASAHAHAASAHALAAVQATSSNTIPWEDHQNDTFLRPIHQSAYEIAAMQLTIPRGPVFCQDVMPEHVEGLVVFEKLTDGVNSGHYDDVEQCEMCQILLHQHPANMCQQCSPTREVPWGALQGVKALLNALIEADQLDHFEEANGQGSGNSRCNAASSNINSNEKEDGTGFGGDSTDHKRLSRRHQLLRTKKLHQTMVLPRYIEILSSLGFSDDFPATQGLPLGHWSELRRHFIPLVRNWLRTSFLDLVGDSCVQVESKIRPLLAIFARWFQTLRQSPRQEMCLNSLVYLLLDPYDIDEEPAQLSNVLNMQVVLALLLRLQDQAKQYLHKVGDCKDKYDRQTLLAWDLVRLNTLVHEVLKTETIEPVWTKIKELSENAAQGRIDITPPVPRTTSKPRIRNKRKRREQNNVQPPKPSIAEQAKNYELIMSQHRVISVNKFKVHRFKHPINHLPATAMRRISAEFASLSSSLPLSDASSIFVSSDESRMDLLKFAIIGPPNTPYQNGFFVFDVMLPPAYPWRAPQACLVTTGHNTVRFNPNLYQDGYICLSLLGTWSGPGWDPQCSNLLQLLVSLQSLIFVSEPYFNEPGYDKLRSDPKSIHSAKQYDARIRKETLRWAILDQLRNPPAGFEECAIAHFKNKKEQIAKQLEEWENANYGYLDKGEIIRCCEEVRRRLEIPIPPPIPTINVGRKRRRRH